MSDEAVSTEVEQEPDILRPDDPELEKFAFSVDELIKDVDNINEVDFIKRQRQVCLCGHSVRCHHPKALVPYCLPGRRRCHCSMFNPVLETTNLRVFKRFSKGNGTLHALTQGIRALMEKGGTYKWLDGACFCYKCKKTDVKIVPALVTTDGYKVRFDEESIINKIDIFLCEECYFNFNKNATLKDKK